MTDKEKLEQLLKTMAQVCALRTARVTAAQTEIKHANAEFDRDALSLGRRINQLRGKIERSQAAVNRLVGPSPDGSTYLARDTISEGDPDWSQEDIDHFKELQRKA